MNNLNFIKLLKLFSNKDLTEFDKFLRSPLYNNQSTLVRLFRELKKYHPGFDHKKLNNDFLFQAVNPGKPFNSIVFRKYISSITKLAEEYLYISGASDDKYRKGLTLLEIYQRAGLENLYAKKEREVSAYMNGKNKINSSFFQNKIWHSEIMFNYLNKNINNEKSLNAITEYQQYLNLYFIHAYANNLGKYHAYNYNFSLTDSYFKKYFKLIGKKYLDDVEKLYTGEELQIFRLIKNDIDLSREDIDPITIGKMSDLVFECRDLLSYNMQYYFLARLNNFCLVMNAKGKPGYKKILFENYKFIFDSGLYFSDGRSTITISEYTGILLSALKVQEFDWAEKFINTCETNNYMKNPDNISLYGLSFLSFYKGEFQKCINYCNRVNLNLFPLRMGMNKINLKSMYELGHFEEAMSFIINYKQYLTKNKSMSKTVILREINFLEYYLTLIKNTKSADKKYLKNILKKLEHETNVADKEWLLSKFSPQKIKDLHKHR